MSASDTAAYDVEVFFDGGCPLCRREIQMLRRRDRRGKILFTDINAANFSAIDLGKTQEELMAQMHGRLPSGQWIKGVEVFRHLYTAIGLGPLVFVSRLPILSQILDLGYGVFARNRERLTGRCNESTCTAGPSSSAAREDSV